MPRWTDYLVGRSPSERAEADKARFLMSPMSTRMGFTQQEIEQNPELQRMRMTPIEMRGFRGALLTRKQAEMQQKIQAAYEKANASIDQMEIPENMRPLLKAEILGGGPRGVIDFLEAKIQRKHETDLELLKAFLREPEEQWELPQVSRGEPGGIFRKGTVTQRGPKGQVKILQEAIEPKAQTTADQMKDISNQYRQWLSLEKTIAQGGLDNPLLAQAIANLDETSPFVKAFKNQDLSALQDIARRARQYWEDQFEEARIKTEYPNAKKDEYGWYVEKDGKKYDVVFSEEEEERRRKQHLEDQFRWRLGEGSAPMR